MTSAPKSAEEIARNIVITYAGDVYPDQIDAIAAAITAARAHQDLVKVLDNTKSKQWPDFTDEEILAFDSNDGDGDDAFSKCYVRAFRAAIEQIKKKMGM